MGRISYGAIPASLVTACRLSVIQMGLGGLHEFTVSLGAVQGPAVLILKHCGCMVLAVLRQGFEGFSRPRLVRTSGNIGIVSR